MSDECYTVLRDAIILGGGVILGIAVVVVAIVALCWLFDQYWPW